jgi:type 1 glutamine amidotransferase
MTPHNPKKALCTWGGWNGHTPEKSMQIVKEILEIEGFQVDFVNSLKPLRNLEKLREYGLIVFCWTMSKIRKDEEKNLIAAVMEGTGLVGWHGGLNDAFRMNVEYQFMTGAQWVSHPGGAGTRYMMHFLPEKAKDPIISGLNDFELTSEQYYLHLDPNIEVLATTTFKNDTMPWIDGVVMPVVYKKRWGDGKIFYVSIGHTYKDFEIPTARELIRRGLLWAATPEKFTKSFDQKASQADLSKAF